MTTEAETIANLAVGARSATTVKTQDGREFLIIPAGVQYHDVTDPHGLHLGNPLYIRQGVTLQTSESLADYVNRFKTATTLLFADIAANSIVALIDYHDGGDGDGDGVARNLAHRATLTLPFSEEYRLWTSISGKLMPQLEFARFVEENAADVRAPEAAELIETVRDLQARRNVNFTKAVRTSSENENFEWTDETEARSRSNGGVEIPTRFRLGFPVYFGEPENEVHAFLRWKLDDGNLLLGIQLHRMEHLRQAVFKLIMLDAAERTRCPIVFGKADR